MALLDQMKPRLHASEASDYLEHGHQLDIDGMGDARLDVLSVMLACLLDN